MIRMVNLQCPKCGMSLDIAVEAICSRCPNCGGELQISVRRMMDIMNDKKEIMQKGVRYATRLSDVKVLQKKKTEQKRIDIFHVVIAALIALTIFCLKWSRVM